jgi:hypothetical protein
MLTWSQSLTSSLPVAVTNGSQNSPVWLFDGRLAKSSRSVTNLFSPPFRLGKPSFPADAKTNSVLAPGPGVYTTSPYACMVVVPGKQADDRSLVKPAAPGSVMPVIEPPMRFNPVNKAK